MNRSRLLAPLAAALLLAACHPERDAFCGFSPPAPAPAPVNLASKALLLQVDYLTNTFEGGTELTFAAPTPTFTVATDYRSPGDFGHIRLAYQELSQPLFDGTIVWAGCGARQFPAALTPAAQFAPTPLTDVAYPGGGFENVFNPAQHPYDYAPVWRAVQGLQVVRDYLASNPTAPVRLFHYQPSVGIGNPADGKWILLLKGQAPGPL